MQTVTFTADQVKNWTDEELVAACDHYLGISVKPGWTRGRIESLFINAALSCSDQPS